MAECFQFDCLLLLLLLRQHSALHACTSQYYFALGILLLLVLAAMPWSVVGLSNQLGRCAGHLGRKTEMQNWKKKPEKQKH